MLIPLLLLILQAPTSASIEGVVTKVGTNDPVPRANVIVTMIQGQLSDVRTVTADGTGRFVVRNLAPDALEITLDDTNGRLDAQVLNRERQPSPAATVVLVPDAPRRQRLELYRSATSDASGRVTLTGIAPGSYKLFAWQDVETSAWQNADFMRDYEDRGSPISISNSDNTQESLFLTVISRRPG